MKVELGANGAVETRLRSFRTRSPVAVSASVPVQIGDLTPPLQPHTTCGAAFDRFQGDSGLAALAVVRGSRPVGLINRYELTVMLASPYGRALYADKPVTALMDRMPLIVERTLDIDRLEAVILAEQPNALLRGFIVTDEGRYYGIGSAISVLRMSNERTARRNRELERAKEEAESANRTKSQFLANMSHELRTPLNAIIGFAELMGMLGESEHLSVRFQGYLDDIRKSGIHLLAIINDVLDMAKIEAGRMELNELLVDMAGTIEAAARLLRERAETGGVALQASIPDGLPPLWADQRILQQILLNLLSNAVKFTPPGGRITVAVKREVTGGVTLTVADTGIGIPPEQVQQVLEPFHQVANEWNRHHPGTGLGLTLVNAFCQMHDATLKILSDLGSGTQVIIGFPHARVIGTRP